jgi:hypothetical protein
MHNFSTKYFNTVGTKSLTSLTLDEVFVINDVIEGPPQMVPTINELFGICRKYVTTGALGGISVTLIQFRGRP